MAFASDGRSILLSSEGTGTPILVLRREDPSTGPLGRLVGGDGGFQRPLLWGVVAVAALLVLFLIGRSRRRRRFR